MKELYESSVAWRLCIFCPATSNVIIGIHGLYRHQHFVCYNLLCSQMGPLNKCFQGQF